MMSPHMHSLVAWTDNSVLHFGLYLLHSCRKACEWCGVEAEVGAEWHAFGWCSEQLFLRKLQCQDPLSFQYHFIPRARHWIFFFFVHTDYLCVPWVMLQWHRQCTHNSTFIHSVCAADLFNQPIRWEFPLSTAEFYTTIKTIKQQKHELVFPLCSFIVWDWASVSSLGSLRNCMIYIITNWGSILNESLLNELFGRSY